MWHFCSNPTPVDEVVVVGFGKQKKESLVSSISTINVKELKAPSSNLTNVIAGELPESYLISEAENPEKTMRNFFIRGIGSFGAGKVDPLILIDGIESSNDDLARLQPDDISDFSVLKDATAAAVYGARGCEWSHIGKYQTGYRRQKPNSMSAWKPRSPAIRRISEWPTISRICNWLMKRL